MAPCEILTIVENDLCIGCGVCAAICPQQVLEMRFNRFGEYNPVQNNECPKKCGLCLKVCPFADENPNENSIGKRQYGSIPQILHRTETGYYSDIFVGYAHATRERGASGGLATWLLSTLLKEGVVDYVIAVIPNDDPDRLFKYTLMSTQEAVLNSAGSAYYPVELSVVLKEIQNKPGKCAIIGLPCFIKAIRLATQKNRKLEEKIPVTAGLVCGQLKSKNYTGYLAALSGVFAHLKSVNYRGKSIGNTANNFYFSCVNNHGDRGKIFWDEGGAEAWINRWFTPNACNYCDDIFAECADATFMDAWLPEYSIDYRGTSIVLVRSSCLKEIIQNGIDSHQLSLNHLPVQDLIQSQGGVIQEKRNIISYRLYLARKKGNHVPIKRVPPRSFAFYPVFRKKIVIREEMRVVSRNFWIDQNTREISDRVMFRKRLHPYLVRFKKCEQISSFFVLPLSALRFILRKIRSSLHG